MKNILLLFATVILFVSCSSREQGLHPESPYEEYIVETRVMPLPNNDYYYQFKKQIFISDTSCFLSVWDLKKKHLAIFDVGNFDLVYQNKNVDFDGMINAAHIHNFDTVYLLYSDGRLVQTDTSFHVFKEMEIKPYSKEHGENYYLGNPLCIENNHIYVGHFPDQPLTTKELRADYFSKYPVMELSLDHPDRVLNYYGKFPEVYQKHDYNVKPCWITVADGDVLTSFWETDSVYRNNTPVASIRSNHFTKNREVDISRMKDAVHNAKLAAENCNYGPLLFNHHTGHYYRMSHFATNYDNKDGTLNSPQEAKKSIIVTDKNFHVIKEVVLPSEYFIYDSYVTPKGLMIKRENANDKENIYFDFFSL